MSKVIYFLPKHACPVCGNKQFIIFESQQTIYGTNRDGEVVSFADIDREFTGKCMKCMNEFPMYQGYDGFVPISKIRSYLKEYQKEELAKTNNIDFYNTRQYDSPVKLMLSASKEMTENDTSDKQK